MNTSLATNIIQLMPSNTPIGFSEFWASYPRRTAKKDAIKAFERALRKVPLETILEAIEAQKQSDQWQRDGGQYIPYPASWLNGERWEDELEVSVSAPAPKASASVTLIANQRALERVEERLKYLKGQFPLVSDKLKQEWNDLRAEKQRLLNTLGFKV